MNQKAPLSSPSSQVKKDWVVLVNRRDRQIGIMEKLAAHREGRLHRAFSVFIFNSSRDLLLQKRAPSKYHCPGLWTNTCCSHPRPSERVLSGARRRLREEMGMEAPLKKVFSFVYKVGFKNGLTEHEFDHVFVGVHDAEPVLNPEEVADSRWVSLEELNSWVNERPEDFTPWFLLCYKRAWKHL